MFNIMKKQMVFGLSMNRVVIIILYGNLCKARIQDVTESTITLMVTGSLKKLDSFLSLVSSYGIVELARTGITAMERGAKSLIENK